MNFKSWDNFDKLMSILKTQLKNKIKQTGVKVDEGQINAKNQVDIGGF